MDNRFHKEWMNHLQETAMSWQYKYYIDADEAYSELLVWYATAINAYDVTRGIPFDTFFFHYRQKALSSLIKESYSWKGKGITFVNILDCNELYTEEDGERILHNLLIELDKVQLTSDAQKILSFILSTDFTEDKGNRRVGKRTVMDKANEVLNWSYRRTEAAINRLKSFYCEYGIA